jgi:hypothetical protein
MKNLGAAKRFDPFAVHFVQLLALGMSEDLSA